MAMTVATITLKDLGATVTLNSDGTAKLSKGWFETLDVSFVDILELQQFLNQYVVNGKVVMS